MSADTFLFYIKNLEEGWTAGIQDIESDDHRKGWLHYKVVHNPNFIDIIGGGISASYVFDSGNYDYGKDLSKLLTP